jgi:ubiquitin C-terminal hydrolase
MFLSVSRHGHEFRKLEDFATRALLQCRQKQAKRNQPHKEAPAEAAGSTATLLTESTLFAGGPKGLQNRGENSCFMNSVL